MARKKNDSKTAAGTAATAEIVRQPITETIEKNFMPYAMSVIVSRALPAIDGFKPSHRKLLYTMYKMGLLGGDRTKSANVVGQTMRLNPHGDQAIYATLVRLTRGNEALLHPSSTPRVRSESITARIWTIRRRVIPNAGLTGCAMRFSPALTVMRWTWLTTTTTR